MPKKTISIRDFRGGLIYNDHGQDVKPDAYTGGTNNDVNRKKGILGMSGKWENLTKNPTSAGDTPPTLELPPNTVIAPGRGLFYFLSDYDNMCTRGDTDPNHFFDNDLIYDYPTGESNFYLGQKAVTNNPTEYYIWGTRHMAVYDSEFFSAHRLKTLAGNRQPGFRQNALAAFETDLTAADRTHDGTLENIPMGGHQFFGVDCYWEVGNHCDIPHKADTVWNTRFVWAYKYYPVFFQAEGGIRICDGSFLEYNSSKIWWGYIIDNGLFSNTEKINNYTFKNVGNANSVRDSGMAPGSHGNRTSAYGAKVNCWVYDKGNIQPPTGWNYTGATDGDDNDRRRTISSHGVLLQPMVKSIYAYSNDSNSNWAASQADHNIVGSSGLSDISATWRYYSGFGTSTHVSTTSLSSPWYQTNGGGLTYCMSDFSSNDTLTVGWNFFGMIDGEYKEHDDYPGEMGFTWKLNGAEPGGSGVNGSASYPSGKNWMAGDCGFRRPGMTWLSVAFHNDGSPDMEAGAWRSSNDEVITGSGNIYLPKGSSKDNPGWRLWAGYMYENGQESQLSEVPAFSNSGPGTGIDKQHYSQHVYGRGWFDIYAAHDAMTRRANPRIRGYRIYLEQLTNDPEADEYIHDSSYKLLCEVDYFKGIRGGGSIDHSSWIRRNEEWHYSSKPYDEGSGNLNNEVTINGEFFDNVGESAYNLGIPGFDEHSYGSRGINGTAGATPYNGGGHDNQGQTHQCWTSVRTVGEETFETLHGYSPESIGQCYYKTAVVTNGRAYVGNVKFNGILYPDRMMKTQVGEYDVFTDDSWIDVTVSDADSIVHLAAYGDKLLQFKKNVVHVIDISKEYEFLEDSTAHNGIRIPSQVTSTERGIFWANKKGLYQYDGEKIISLFEDIGFNVAAAMPTIATSGTHTFDVTSSEWSEIIEETDEIAPIVTYDPFKKNVIIMNQGNAKAGSSVEDKGFIWNIDRKNLTQTFSTFDSLPARTEKSNAIINQDGEPVVIQSSVFEQTADFTSAAGVVIPYPKNSNSSPSDSHSDEMAHQHTAVMKKWNYAAADHSEKLLLYESQAIDFGDHSRRKVIKSISFTYKANAITYLIPRITAYKYGNTAPEEYYLTTSDAASVSNSNELDDNDFPGILPSTSDKVHTYRYTHCLATSNTGSPKTIRSLVKNVTAIKVALVNLYGGAIPKTFELEDLSITYKEKSAK